MGGNKTSYNRSNFYHITRNPELVVIKDRDVMAFIPDIILENATSGMEIWGDENENFLRYGSAVAQDVCEGQRLLLFARLSSDEIVSAFRWTPYITSNDADVIDIQPLREVFAPRVTYDRTSNQLHLWFWTNVNYDYNGSEYDESQICPIESKEFCRWIDTDGGGTQGAAQRAKRVLCYAIGQIHHAYVKGGFVGGYEGAQGTGFEDAQYDLVPVFTRPRIMNFDVTNVEKVGPGIVVDGWYEINAEGPQGPSLTGPPGPPGAQGPQGNQGGGDEAGPMGPAGEQGCYCTVSGTSGPSGPPACLNGLQGPGLQGAACVSGPSEPCPVGGQGQVGLDGPIGAQGPAGPTGNAGPQGNQGVTGPQGLKGNDGFAGATGLQGNVGLVGATGPIGPIGAIGETGVDGGVGVKGSWGAVGTVGAFGAFGAVGDSGSDGTNGSDGADGDDGPQGSAGPLPKTAIVNTKSGFRELSCVEMPEVHFVDTYTLQHDGGESRHEISSDFIDSCGDIILMSRTCSEPILFSTKIIRNEIVITAENNAVLNVMIGGTRKGFKGRRFAERTQEAFEKNEQFWSTPKNKDSGV